MPLAASPPEHPEPEAPIRLLPPRLVPLDPEREQLAVRLLAELLAQYLQSRTCPGRGSPQRAAAIRDARAPASHAEQN